MMELSELTYKLRTETEVWRTLDEYPNYKFSSLGKIIDKEGNELKTYIKESKYSQSKCLIVNIINKDGVRQNRSVANLIATVFVLNPNKYKKIIHKDNDVYNNNYHNLIWYKGGRY